MDLTQFLLHAGHESDGALGFDVVPVDPIAQAMIVVGLVLIVAGLYRLHTYDPVPNAVEDAEADA
jgi:hypothetical protein